MKDDKVKRYDLCWEWMEESEDGFYVEHEDYANLEAENARLMAVAPLAKMLSEQTEGIDEGANGEDIQRTRRAINGVLKALEENK